MSNVKLGFALYRTSYKSNEGIGPSSQKQKLVIEKAANELGATIVDGESTDSLSDEDMQRMYDWCLENPDISHLFVTSYNRLCRSYFCLTDWIAKFAEINVIVKSVDFAPEGWNSLSILSAFAEQQRKAMSESTKRGMANKASLGYSMSAPPLGYARTFTKGLHTPNNLGKLLYLTFKNVSDKTCTLPEAYQRLSFGVDSHTGRQLRKCQFVALFTNPYYAGLICWNGQTYKGLHQPLVSTEQQEMFAKLLREF